MSERGKRTNAGSHNGRNEENEPLYHVGDVVQAKYQGGRTYFTCIVVKERHEGTYHVVYTDGMEETKRKENTIRHPVLDDLLSKVDVPIDVAGTILKRYVEV